MVCSLSVSTGIYPPKRYHDLGNVLKPWTLYPKAFEPMPLPQVNRHLLRDLIARDLWSEAGVSDWVSKIRFRVLGFRI